MKEKLYTLDLTDAVKAGDECLFCWLERKLEQDNLEFVLRSSYMEGDIREETSRRGFCRHHTKMMYDYGNTLGNAWILKSRLEYLNREMKQRLDQSLRGTEAPEKTGAGPAAPQKGGFLGRLLGGDPGKAASPAGVSGASGGASGLEAWIRSEETHCYICGRMKTVYERMLDTFAYLLASEPEFGRQLMESGGFCLPHFADALEVCRKKLKPQEQAEWLPKLGKLMERSLDRIQGDIDWLIEKYDYRNRDADWKQSRDAVQRTMQKIVSGHPADPVFREKK